MSFEHILSGQLKTPEVYNEIKRVKPEHASLLDKSGYGKKQGIELIKLGYSAAKSETNR
jgi:hypothetical protein